MAQIRKALIGLIRLYQIALSTFLGPCCRFEPSCSQYAIEAIRTHGALKGFYLTLRRVLRCHPWHQGGIDVVPKVSAKTLKHFNNP